MHSAGLPGSSGVKTVLRSCPGLTSGRPSGVRELAPTSLGKAIVHISSQMYLHWLNISRLKWAEVGAFILGIGKCYRLTLFFFSFRELSLTLPMDGDRLPLRGGYDLGLGGALQMKQFPNSLELSASNLPSSWGNISLLPEGGTCVRQHGTHDNTVPVSCLCCYERARRWRYFRFLYGSFSQQYFLCSSKSSI